MLHSIEHEAWPNSLHLRGTKQNKTYCDEIDCLNKLLRKVVGVNDVAHAADEQFLP